MSADLFAAFGVPATKKVGHTTTSADKSTTAFTNIDGARKSDEDQWILQSQPIPQSLRKQHETPLWNKDGEGTDVLFDASDDDAQDDDDDFGDFEAASNEITTKAIHPGLQSQSPNSDLLGLEDFTDMHITKSSERGPALQQLKPTTNDLLGIESQLDPYTFQDVGSENMWVQPLPTSDLNDSKDNTQQGQEQAFADDDWGNFEDVEADAQAEVTSLSEYRNNTKIEAKPVKTAETILSQTVQPKLLPVYAGSVHDDNDDNEDAWDDFEDGPTPTAPPKPQLTKPATIPETSNPTINPQSLSATPHERPTNIPPPSTLLQLLPQIYQVLSSQSRLPNPPPHLAQEISQIYSTSARILAGRAHRWKRDTLLSQSTRISQAGLKNTGMKLTALDKSETIKEDQEAQEAVSTWRRHAAVLNAVMLKAKVQRPPMSLGVSMGVKAASGPGVLTARECCAVCGLKRNERVLGIDVMVEDSFGEFWIEFWGHKDCVWFWYTYQEMLRQR